MKEKGEVMPGTLYLCATPIGNLEDMTFRVIRILKEVDLIAAEDTRNSIKLLNHFEITTPMTSYHEYNKYEKGRKLVERLLEGQSIALITDAGTPGISDPGEDLVRICQEEKKEREKVLEELERETRTTILYEAPHRLIKTLELLKDRLGEQRKITVCRELTKRHETAFRATLAEAAAYYKANDPKGECVLVIEGRSREEIEREEKAKWEELSIEQHMEQYLAQGSSKKEAMKLVAKDRGVPKREIYNYLERDAK